MRSDPSRVDRLYRNPTALAMQSLVTHLLLIPRGNLFTRGITYIFVYRLNFFFLYKHIDARRFMAPEYHLQYNPCLYFNTLAVSNYLIFFHCTVYTV